MWERTRKKSTSRQPTTSRRPKLPTLDVRLVDFQGRWATLNGHENMPVSELQVLKVACTVGVPIMMAASPTSTHAVTLAAYKALAIKAAVDFTGTELARPAEYVLMDPSEKANISFWTGMTFASLVANDILNIPWLWHATAFRRLGLLTVTQRQGALRISSALTRRAPGTL